MIKMQEASTKSSFSVWSVTNGWQTAMIYSGTYSNSARRCQRQQGDGGRVRFTRRRERESNSLADWLSRQIKQNSWSLQSQVRAKLGKWELLYRKTRDRNSRLLKHALLGKEKPTRNRLHHKKAQTHAVEFIWMIHNTTPHHTTPHTVYISTVQTCSMRTNQPLDTQGFQHATPWHGYHCLLSFRTDWTTQRSPRQHRGYHMATRKCCAEGEGAVPMGRVV